MIAPGGGGGVLRAFCRPLAGRLGLRHATFEPEAHGAGCAEAEVA
jgi:hypothetical protein